MLNTVQSLVTKKRVTENASSFAAPVIRGDIPPGNGSAAWEMEHHGNRQAARKPGEAKPRGGAANTSGSLHSRHFSELRFLGPAGN